MVFISRQADVLKTKNDFCNIFHSSFLNVFRKVKTIFQKQNHKIP